MVGMTIGIIGAGTIGGTLARRLRALGHEVAIANSRGPESLRDFAAETGAKAVTAKEAARSGEIVIVSIPEKGVTALPKDLFDGVPADVAVVDTGNYYPFRDGDIPAVLQEGKVLSAVYRVGPHKTSTGTPMGYALRLLVEPKAEFRSSTDQLAVAN